MGWLAVLFSLCFAGALAMPGGWYEGQVSDPDVLQLLDEFYYPSSALSAEDLELVRVQQQIVSGVNYRLTFNIADTDEQCQVVIYYQEWTGTRQVLEDSCTEPEPEPRTGGWEEGDPEDPEIQALLEEVYFPHSLVGAEDVSLVAVQTQLVAGINYRMTFEIAATDGTCEVVIFIQEWTNTKEVSSDTCEDAIVRPARQSMPGGWSDGDIHEPAYLELFNEAYLSSSDVDAEDLELTRIETQVVAGMNYRYTFNKISAGEECQVIIFYQSWTETKRVTQDTCSTLEPQNVPMPGGWMEHDVNDPNALQLLEEFYFPSSGVGAEDVNLVKVETQVVAGINYRMTFEIPATDGTCEVVIFTQEWTNTTEVTSDTCEDAIAAPATQSMPGGWGDGDIHEPAYLELFNEVYLSSSDVDAEDLELTRIETQVVAGMNYRYTFNKISAGEECQVIIFYQSWTETKRVTQDTCSTLEPQNVPMPGGWTEHDVNDPNALQLLEDFYFPSSGVGAEDVNLVKVETQVVAGINYRMSFEIPATDGTCEVVIFTQEWTNTTEVTSDTCEDAIVVAATQSMPGGWSDGDIHDPAYLELLNDVYSSNSDANTEDLELTRIETQVVAGANYRYTFNKLSTEEECKIVIFYQPWTSTATVTEDTCFIPEPRVIGGGWADGDLDDPLVAQLLEEVYFPSSPVGAEDVTLTRVETQIVAGTNYKMTFEIQSGDICTAIIFTQEWTNTREVVEDNCAQAVENAEIEIEPENVPMPGGWMEHDVNDPNALQLLEEFYFPSSGVGAEDVNLVKVETQVVAGINYRMTFEIPATDGTCEVVIFTQEWTNTKEVTSDTCEDAIVVAATQSMPGGWGDGDIHEPAYLELFNEVYLSSSDVDAEDLELTRIETQVVAGMNYRYTFNKISAGEECQVIIFYQSWTDTKRVTQDTCSTLEPQNVPMSGGWMEHDVNDPNALQLLEDFYFPSSGVGAEDVNLVKVETQVVAGINYRMSFEVPATGGTCEVVIFTQDWTNTKEVSSDTCEDAIVRPARQSIPGGWSDGDIHEPAYLELFNEVYLSSSDVDAEDLELTRIETQVVAGMNYRYTFNKISVGEECQITIFHQPWTNTKVVTLDTCFIPEPRVIAGGWTEGSIDDPKVEELLDEVYFPSSIVGANDVRLVKVETQLVAGVNYKMTFEVPSGETCTVVIFTQSWTNTREVAEDYCADAIVDVAREVEAAEPQPVPVEPIEPEVVPMTGSYTEQDVNDPTAVALLNEVYFPHSLVGANDVTRVKVETQLVSGVNYRITFELPGTDTQCQVVIYTQEWTNTKEVASDTCERAVVEQARSEWSDGQNMGIITRV